MEVKAETRQSVPYGMPTRTHFFYLQNQITTDLIKKKKKKPYSIGSQTHLLKPLHILFLM